MSLVKSTGVVALSTLCSRILGLVRDVLMAAYFGAARTADVFYVAFMIPNLFRRLVAEGALTISFIPVYTETLIKEGEEEAKKLAVKTMSVQFFAIALIVAAGIIFSPYFMKIFFGRNDTPEIFNLSVNLIRLMFPYLFFVGFVAFAMGYLNSHRIFFAPAFSPVLLNVGIITGIVGLSKLFAESIYGVAIGVLLGGLLQFLLQLPYLKKSGFKFYFSLDFKHPGIRNIFKMLTPALFGIAVYQINTLVSNFLASMISEGSVTYIYYTNRLTELVLGVFIISIGNVILPEMSRLSASADSKRFKDLFSASLSSAIFISIPAAVGLISFGVPIISVIFMHGRFTFNDCILIYSSLVTASIGIVFIAGLRITTQAFYSMKDTKTPVISATVALVLNIIFGYTLMQTSLKHAGLTLANSISAAVQMMILFLRLKQTTGGVDLKKVLFSFLKSAIAALFMGIAVYLFSMLINWQSSVFYLKLIYMTLIIISAGIIYFFLCYLLKSEEVYFILKRVRSRL